MTIRNLQAFGAYDAYARTMDDVLDCLSFESVQRSEVSDGRLDSLCKEKVRNLTHREAAGTATRARVDERQHPAMQGFHTGGHFAFLPNTDELHRFLIRQPSSSLPLHLVGEVGNGDGGKEVKAFLQAYHPSYREQRRRNANASKAQSPGNAAVEHRHNNKSNNNNKQTDSISKIQYEYEEGDEEVETRRMMQSINIINAHCTIAKTANQSEAQNRHSDRPTCDVQDNHQKTHQGTAQLYAGKFHPRQDGRSPYGTPPPDLSTWEASVQSIYRRRAEHFNIVHGPMVGQGRQQGKKEQETTRAFAVNHS